MMQEALNAARTAGMKAVLLTRWSGVASTLEVSPTNKDFYRAHKFKPTGLAPRRAEYAIWRKDM